MAIFRYLPRESYALDLLKRGRFLCQPLAYYRAQEDGEVRGDARDGELRHAPKDGLVITKADATQVTLDGVSFSSAARHETIYVFCASTELSVDIARAFNSPFCVEIHDPDRFADRIRRRADRTSRFDYAGLVAGPIDYRELHESPQADWALPERLAFIKPPSFAWQAEYRIAIPHRGAFDPYNVVTQLQAGSETAKGQASPRPAALEVGSIAEFATLHRFEI